MNRKLKKNIRIIESHNIRFTETNIEHAIRTKTDQWRFCRDSEVELDQQHVATAKRLWS